MIRVSLHVAGMHHYREIVAELVGAIHGSGLYDEAETLTVCTVGDVDLLGLMGERWQVVKGGSLEQYEYPTLRLIHTDAQSQPDVKYLYLHTKGVSRPRLRASRDAWRRYMTRFLITEWRHCVDLLDRCDTVGTELRLPPQNSPAHYAGNFWWANGSHLAQLPAPSHKFVWRGERFGAETWLLESTPNASCYSFHQFNFQFFNRVIPEYMYHGAQVANGFRTAGEAGISEVIPQLPSP